MENVENASGLFNLVRNLGGSLGIGLFGTIVSRRYALHVSRLSEGFSYTDAPSVQRLNETTGAFQGIGLALASAKNLVIVEKSLQVWKTRRFLPFDHTYRSSYA